MRKILTIIAIAMLAKTAIASSDSAVVNKLTCVTLANTTNPFILVLDKGDDLLESITNCARDAKLKGAAVNALGQVHNPTLAYFTSEPKDKPTLTTFQGYYELASLTGNIAVNGNGYYTHVHGVLADPKFQGIAGHFESAKVGLTVEVTITPFTGKVERAVDPDTGFGPIIH